MATDGIGRGGQCRAFLQTAGLALYIFIYLFYTPAPTSRLTNWTQLVGAKDGVDFSEMEFLRPAAPGTEAHNHLIIACRIGLCKCGQNLGIWATLGTLPMGQPCSTKSNTFVAAVVLYHFDKSCSLPPPAALARAQVAMDDHTVPSLLPPPIIKGIPPWLEDPAMAQYGC